MPNVLLFTTGVASELIDKFMDELGPALRQATADALGDVNNGQVAVLHIRLSSTSNMTAMQIFAVGSTSSERQDRLRRWAIYLAKAWRRFATSHSIEWGDNVDVWPILPEGFWLMATEEKIRWAEQLM